MWNNKSIVIYVTTNDMNKFSINQKINFYNYNLIINLGMFKNDFGFNSIYNIKIFDNV